MIPPATHVYTDDPVGPDALADQGIDVEQPTERERREHRAARVIDCPRCHGDGEIGIRGYSHNPNCGFPTPDPQCDTTARCPECHGDGTVRADDFTCENEARDADTPGPLDHKEH